MTPCVRCDAPATSEIITPSGNMDVCEFCADSWFAMTFSDPIETFYGEVFHD